jgi:hypothetical protein
MEPELLEILRQRFENNMHRHRNILWCDVLNNIVHSAAAPHSLKKMEETGGEPDVIGMDDLTGCYIFVDCCKETPVGRRNLCYDGDALKARKENKPNGCALDMANEMGITVLNEAEYRQIQAIESFDCKTSSWLLTPDPIRKLGGALFGDRRYNHIFVYHNGAQSYYAVRGFRGKLLV